ncbi:MAG: hypothetical protein NC483_05005 [Ruminococcus sp.]|nr:hypothetical protein [Ruminococcus sp.]
MKMGFICPDCQIEVTGIVNSEKIKEGLTMEGTRQIVRCPICNKDFFVEMLNNVVLMNDENTESMMYDPSKIAKDGSDYDMQPKRR